MLATIISHAAISAGPAVSFVDPPNGSLIVASEGTLNVTTITCNIVNSSNNQENTIWRILNFRGIIEPRVLSDEVAPELFHFSGYSVSVSESDSTQTYRNRLTILIMDSDLDQVTISCGSNTHTQAYFGFRIYRK